MLDLILDALTAKVSHAVLYDDLGPIDGLPPLFIPWERSGGLLSNAEDLRWDVFPKTRVRAVALADSLGVVYDIRALPDEGEYFSREGSFYVRRGRLRLGVVVRQ